MYFNHHGDPETETKYNLLNFNAENHYRAIYTSTIFLLDLE